MKKIAIISFTLVALIASVVAAFGQGSERVVKAQGHASVDAVRPGDKFKIAVALEVADGYHINAHRPSLDYLFATNVSFELPAGVRISEVKYPAPKYQNFEFAPETKLAVLEGKVVITAQAEADNSLKQGAHVIRARVQVQSCNDKQCLQPSDLSVEIPLQVAAADQAVKQMDEELFAKAATAPGEIEAPQTGDSSGLVQFQGSGQPKKDDNLSALITSRGIGFALLSVFLAGLLLNTTPCVYPIIPITIGFFVNQGEAEGAPRLRRTFLMASMYVFGMALTYSLLGVVASMTSGLFGAALQNPIVLIGLAGLMVALALSMFGAYEFRLPEFLNRFANRSTQSTSGVLGALVMGLTMGIVAAPCIGPFVLGLLVHVGTKGDPVYGFFLFFVLALGLGMPYLVLGTFSGALKALPRSGLWMVTVRKVFGLVLIGMALYFLMPLMGDYSAQVFVAFFAISALYLIFWEAGRAKPKQFGWALRAIGIGVAAIAVAMVIPKEKKEELRWQPFSEEAVAAARKEGKAVIIDAFADWCIPCKELDHLTFTDRAVQKEAERFVRLKLDLTKNDPQSEAGRARNRFEILGVPTIIFIDGAGRERTSLRLEGFEKPEAFIARLKQVESAPAPSDTVFAKTASDEKGAASDAAVGASKNGEYSPLPSLSLNRLDGAAMNLESLRGKVVLIDFWATWCVPCISEIPMFNEFSARYKDRGFEMIAISLDEEGAAKVKPFLKAHPMNYTQVIGDQKVAAAFKVADSSLPVALLVDKQGRIRFTRVGITKKETFEAEINQLLSE